VNPRWSSDNIHCDTNKQWRSNDNSFPTMPIHTVCKLTKSHPHKLQEIYQITNSCFALSSNAIRQLLTSYTLQFYGPDVISCFDTRHNLWKDYTKWPIARISCHCTEDASANKNVFNFCLKVTSSEAPQQFWPRALSDATK